MDRQPTTHRLRLFGSVNVDNIEVPLPGVNWRVARVFAFERIVDQALAAIGRHGQSVRRGDIDHALFLHDTKQFDESQVGRAVVAAEAARMVWQQRENALLDAFHGMLADGSQPRAHERRHSADDLCNCFAPQRMPWTRRDGVPSHSETCLWTAYDTIRRFALNHTAVNGDGSSLAAPTGH